ncbi:MAG: RluA family pseudouridine synthase [Saprospiraceae bacterium]|nr:RluA family pseudouridine synthase [Saprospiraceae bacterium]
MTEIPLIVFEDKHLMVLDKPAGMVCEAGQKANKLSVQQWVLEHFITSGQKAKNLIAGICHRLDKPVSGLMVVAKKPSSLKELNLMFQRKLVHKYYHALVEADASAIPLHPSLFLLKDEKIVKAIVKDQPATGYKTIKSEFECIEHNAEYSVLKIRIYTGRFHQIRSSLSFLGFPVWNDQLYGAKYRSDIAGIGLQATRLDFVHPISREPMSFSIENRLKHQFID